MSAPSLLGPLGRKNRGRRDEHACRIHDANKRTCRREVRDRVLDPFDVRRKKVAAFTARARQAIVYYGCSSHEYCVLAPSRSIAIERCVEKRTRFRRICVLPHISEIFVSVHGQCVINAGASRFVPWRSYRRVPQCDWLRRHNKGLELRPAPRFLRCRSCPDAEKPTKTVRRFQSGRSHLLQKVVPSE